jgi:sulfur carrier protein ThiS
VDSSQYRDLITLAASKLAVMNANAYGTVKVETFPLRPGTPAMHVPLAKDMTLDELLEALEVPGDTEAVIVNGTYVRPDYRLRQGDHVLIIPFMSGG